MFQYRVTKYNPLFRNEEGHYLKDEWTQFQEIGRTIGGKVLLLEDYEATESASIETAIRFFEESGVRTLKIEGLEDSGRTPLVFKNGDSVPVSDLRTHLKGVLREKFWARFEQTNAFLHIGWDFYMYIGVPLACDSPIEFAKSRNIFVEVFDSPYREL